MELFSMLAPSYIYFLSLITISVSNSYSIRINYTVIAGLQQEQDNVVRAISPIMCTGALINWLT